MEDRKSIKLILAILTLAFLPAFVFAYEADTTHNALTDEIVDFYNYSYPTHKLTDTEKVLVKRGSVEEDSPDIRVLNHFYDPIRNVGFKSVNNTSKAWAMNAGLQSNNDQFAGTGGLLLDTFTSPSDFSWERAIFDYTYVDKERGLVALGHILHLIEDATVPDHVRDDAHPPAFSFGSPYEAYANQYTESNIETANQLIREYARPVELASIGDYFDTVATFTNTNFFSKDTIFDEKYTSPDYISTRSERLKDGTPNTFGISNKGFRLLLINYSFDQNTGLISKNYSIQDRDNLILSDYWNILSRTAVKNGAGIIKLFFDEVEKEKQTGTLLAKNKSMWSKLIDSANTAIKSVFTSASTTATSNSLASVASVSSNTTTVIPTSQNTQLPTTSATTQTSVTQKQTTPTTQSTTVTQKQVSPQTVVPPLFAISPGFGGGAPGVSAKNENATVSTDSPSTPIVINDSGYIVVLSPTTNSQIFGTSTVTFSGTSTPFSTVGLDLAMATTTTSASGEWSLSLILSSGTTTLTFYSVDPANARATSTTQVSVYLDTTGPTFSLAVPVCDMSLASDGCVVATTTVSMDFATDDGDFAYFTVGIDGVYVTTTDSATTTVVSNDALHTIEISARDILGNQSATTTRTLFTSTFPVVINEVAWAGTLASSTGEWIELYNKTPFTIPLSSWTLFAESMHPYIPLTGTISGHDYYLLERGDDTAVSTVSADQVYGDDSVDWALSNSGDQLVLVFASTTIDQTAPSGPWMGGINTQYKKSSMERYDPFVTGDDMSNWDTSLVCIQNGTDRGGNAIYGTPRSKNGLSYLLNKNHDLNSDMTLTREHGPYLIVNRLIKVPVGHTLYAEPGVLVKSLDGGFDFQGKFISKGTSAQPAVFTSLYDDDYGGDLNTDGDATFPRHNDWQGLYFSSGATGSKLDGLLLRHSLGNFIEGATVSGHDITIERNLIPFKLFDSTVTFDHLSMLGAEDRVLQFYNSTGTISNMAVSGNFYTESVVTLYGSSLSVDNFDITDIPWGEGFLLYTGALSLRNGTITGIKEHAIHADNGKLDMDNVHIGVIDNYETLILSGGIQASITNSVIEHDPDSIWSVGLVLYGTSSGPGPMLYVASTTIRNNTIGIQAESKDQIVIDSSEIVGAQYGIITKNVPMSINNSSIASTTEMAIWNVTPDTPVSALHNWWGDATGPYHPTLNPSGQGGEVSDGVDFDPWLTYDPLHPVISTPPTV
ncbi:MAG: hypothetical protein RLZZ347_416, partial [Candidatus Parcubacteria bacterium]